MDCDLNCRACKEMENYFQKQIEQGRKVSCEIKPIFEGKSMRPSRLEIIGKSDREKLKWNLLNEPGQEFPFRQTFR